MASFDCRRLQMSQYNDLDDIDQKLAFMQTVVDYMNHVHLVAKSPDQFDHEQEAKAAGDFVGMIDHDDRWELARAMAIELQDRPDHASDLPFPLDMILGKVEERIHTGYTIGLGTELEAQRCQEEIAWRRCKRMIEYIGWMGGELRQTPDGRLEEVDSVVDIARRVRHRTANVSMEQSDSPISLTNKGKGKAPERKR